MVGAVQCYVFNGSKTGYQKNCSEDFIEYFSHSKNGMAKCVSTKKIFPQF